MECEGLPILLDVVCPTLNSAPTSSTSIVDSHSAFSRRRERGQYLLENYEKGPGFSGFYSALGCALHSTFAVR